MAIHISEHEASAAPNQGRRAGLTCIALTQPMLTLDVTIVNVALPSLQADPDAAGQPIALPAIG
jgi:hypothetical protein